MFMDIIMPNLDGVSATAMIRMVAPGVPIVAMTSNIRQEDIQTYFQFGKSPPASKTHLSPTNPPNPPHQE
jgi:osomolarity two-component system response regulator SKN7